MASELRDQLQSTLGRAYTLERELGGGGMSRVFLATETRLGRTVVVKVLPTELAAGLSAERFEREIRLVAQLQHPSIVPVLSAGDTEGMPYYTMPFVAGASLRARLTEVGALPIPEVVRILRDVARGLDYAHHHGVVHRDIKPENILLSGDGAVITDFGIAKAVSASRTMASGAITEAGTMVGTPHYMAPEQVAGDPDTDHRADLYAFGATAYEMLTGVAPFHGRAPHQILAAHLSEVPRPVATVRTDAPAGLTALVMRCLEKDRTRRPQGARELLEALDSAATPAAQAARGGLRPSPRFAFAIVVIAALLAITLVAIRRGGNGPSSDGASLAVIPFRNVGGDSAQEYFAEGMSDELATAIGRLPGVHVAARSAAYRYRGRRDLDARELGRTLGVRYLVQGSLYRAGEKLRVSAQLSDATTGVEMWSQSFDRDFKDVLALQDEVSRAITTALQPRFAGASGEHMGTPLAHGTADAEAYDLFLRGDYLLRRRDVPGAADAFERAIARDTTFARAYAALSQTLELFPYYVGTPAPEIAVRATRAARHALTLDSSSARARVALGMVHMHAWRWDSAEAEFAHAAALAPEDAETHLQYGRLLYYHGDDARAMAELQRARVLDPYSGVVSAWISVLMSQNNQIDAALVEAQRALALDSTASVVAEEASHVFVRAGQLDRARRLVARLPDAPPWSGTKAATLSLQGDRSAAERIVRALLAQRPTPWMGNAALGYAYLGLGDTSRALGAFERATDAREIWPTFQRVKDPLFDPIRGSKRWEALLGRIALGSARTSPNAPSNR